MTVELGALNARRPTGAPGPAGDEGHGGEAQVRLLPWAVFLAVHGPLAIAMRQSPRLATAHALGTLLLGTWWACNSRLELVAYVGAYIGAAEVLWRMCRCELPWEFGKYATCLVFIIATVRSRPAGLPVLPILYFALQLPSIGLVVGNPDLHQLRSDLSFYLSGPFSLMVIALFYGRLVATRDEIARHFLVFLGPACGIASVALFRIATSTSLRMIGGSNSATSGGFGPNQVSAVLGLGSMLALLCTMTVGRNLVLKVFLVGLSLALAGQSMLTFSRTGLYCACGSLLVASVFSGRDLRAALRLVAVLGVTAMAFYFAVFPLLSNFTNGGIAKRFADTNSTGRDQLMLADLELWRTNPIFGVGPGASLEAHVLLHGEALASHSELTRLLAEHGVFGLVALVSLLVTACGNCLRAPVGLPRIVIISLAAWGLLYMFSNGMRIVTPSFVLGLSFCTMIPGAGGRGDD
jgi:O-antigen ligase